MKKNKGIAMAYTVMAMAIVFAVCLVAVTVMISQASIAATRSRDAVTETIGEIFCDCADVEPSEFVLKLKEAGFEVDEDMIVTHSKLKLALNTSHSGDEYTLVISNVSLDTTYLTVKVRVSQGEKIILLWERG